MSLLGTAFDARAVAARESGGGGAGGGGVPAATTGSLSLKRGTLTTKAEIAAALDVGPITAARIARARNNEVRDAEGNQRFHGAFTGGFSAGYFNTVGSKEDWKPSTFVSSKRLRATEAAGTRSFSDRVQDLMDDEDQQSLTLLNANERYDTMGFAGLRRGQQLAEAASSAASRDHRSGSHAGEDVVGTHTASVSAISSGLLSGGSLPTELVVSTSTPLGRELLQLCGWREGQPLGRPRPEDRRLSLYDSDVLDRRKGEGDDAPAAVIASLWKDSANRASGGRTRGIGYVRDSLVPAEAGGSEGGPGLQPTRFAAQQALGAAQSSLGRIAMGGSTLALRRGAEGGKNHASGGRAAQKGAATKTALLSFALDGGRIGFDDDGDADIAYEDGQATAAALAYTATRISSTAGAGASGRQGADAALLIADGNFAGTASHPAAPLAHASHPAPSSPARIDARHHGSDGRPSLPGFHVSKVVERSFLRYAREHPPLVPPPGWRPFHVFPPAAGVEAADRAPPLPGGGSSPHGGSGSTSNDIRVSGVALSAAGVRGAATAAVSLQPHSLARLPPPATATSGAQPLHSAAAAAAPAAPTVDPFADKFQRGQVEGSAASAAQALQGLLTPAAMAASSVAAAAAAGADPAPSAGGDAGWLTEGAARRSSLPWAPARLLCKRMNVPDPVAPQIRAASEAQARAAAPSLPPSGMGSTWGAAASDAALGASGQGSLQPVPRLHSRPPTSLFERIFS